MKTVSLAEAKAHLSELVENATTGETICITKRGKPVAHITAAERPRQKIDFDELRRFHEGQPMQTESAGDFVRRMRDEDRY